MFIQQGDVKLFQTPDDGEISVVDGTVEMEGGFSTMAYLCLFGGNIDDPGGDNKNKSWWGNAIEERSERLIRSETQYLLETLPAVPPSLIPLRDAALRDLDVFLTEKIASEVTVEVSMPGLNRVHINGVINAFGQLYEFEFTENWEPREPIKPLATNQVWRDGTTGQLVAIYDEDNYPIDDYGYPCYGGTLNAAYAAELSGLAATNPPWRRQCDDTETQHPPLSLADLKGWPLNDFDNAPCRTVEVGDSNWQAKGYGVFGNAGVMVDGKYHVGQTGTTQSVIFYGATPTALVRSLEASVTVLVESDFSHAIGIVVWIGGIQYGLHHIRSGPGVYKLAVTKDGVSQILIATTATPTFKARLTRDGVNVYCYFDDVLRFSEPNAGTPTLVVPSDMNPTGSTGQMVADFFDVSVRDAAVGGDLVHNSVIGMTCPSLSQEVADWHADGGGHVAYIDLAQQPLGAAAWLCIAGILVRAHRVGVAYVVTPDNPPFLDQCPTPAANLSELLGWPASDDFSGSVCNSGVEGDDNWDLRGWVGWVTGSGIAPTIVDSALRLDIGGGGNSNSILENNHIDHSGDFTVEITGLSMSHPASGYYWFNIRVQVGVERFYAGFHYNGVSTVGHYFEYPGGNVSVPSASETPTYKFVRTGNTLRAYYGNTQIGADKTVSGNLNNLLPYSVSDTDAINVAFEAISVVDGSGDPIYIDPEGESC